MRQLKLIWMLVKMKLSHMMVFRLSFFGAFFVDGTMFAIQLLVFSAIYANVDSIGGWTRGEMIVVYRHLLPDQCHQHGGVFLWRTGHPQ